ncbi:MAG: helix-turn-helix domain-containing protein [Usitatibacter sp.]
MAKKIAPLLPVAQQLLGQLGDRLRLARLRRRLTAAQVAERSGMAPMTLRSVERGGAGVTIGAYAAVMQVLGIEKDLELLASADPLGRELQDARLDKRMEPRGRPAPRVVKLTSAATAKTGKAPDLGPPKTGYPTARTLAGLIKTPGTRRGR